MPSGCSIHMTPPCSLKVGLHLLPWGTLFGILCCFVGSLPLICCTSSQLGLSGLWAVVFLSLFTEIGKDWTSVAAHFLVTDMLVSSSSGISWVRPQVHFAFNCSVTFSGMLSASGHFFLVGVSASSSCPSILLWLAKGVLIAAKLPLHPLWTPQTGSWLSLSMGVSYSHLVQCLLDPLCHDLIPYSSCSHLSPWGSLSLSPVVQFLPLSVLTNCPRVNF